MTHILRTSAEHKTASLADEGNSAYCQSSGAHNIKHIQTMEINIERSPQHYYTLREEILAGRNFGGFG